MSRPSLAHLLPRFSITRRVTVLVMVASMVVMGLVAALSIKLELIPAGFTPPFLGVVVPWRDAPPSEVLEKIVEPLEDELSTLPSLERLDSFCTTGFGRCFMMFKTGTDMDVAYREVRDRIQRARAQLPSDADRIYIRQHDPESIPVYVVGLAVNPDITDPYDLIQNTIVVHLQRLNGVADVDVNGLEEKEIFIDLDRQRTEGSGLNIYQLAMDLGSDNFSMASGDIREGSRKLLLRSVARYRDLDDLENRQLNAKVKLKDVGSVSYQPPEAKFRVRANSRPAVALIIRKEGQANTLKVARDIRRELLALQSDPKLQGISMVPIFDQGRVILESLKTLLDSGKIGGIFAALVLFFFLRRLRMTLIITLAIPLSLLVALVAMFFAEESLNILSLLGLMISVGLLVDNSVVVAENIHRMHRSGLPRKQAAIQGTGEIALAILMATLTTVIVFLPVALVQGQFQFFLLRLSLPICVSVVASLIVATVFVPLTVYLTLPNGNVEKTGVRRLYQRFTQSVSTLYEATLGRVNRGYTRLLKHFLQRRMDLVMAVLAIALGTQLAAQKWVKVVDVQDEERSGFEIRVEMPQSTTLPEAEAYFLACEKVIEEMQDELGLSGWFLFHLSTFGELQGFFEQPRTHNISPREACARVMERLPKKAGVALFAGSEQEQEEKGAQVETVTLFGEDADTLDKVSAGLADRLLTIDGVLGMRAQGDPPPNELALVIDRDQAQARDINPQVIAGVVGYALRGQTLNRYRSEGRDIPVRIRFREDDRETLTQLQGFLVPTGRAGALPLSAVTQTKFLSSSRGIQRVDKRTSESITLELQDGREKETRARIRTALSRYALPEGVRFGNRQTHSMQEDLKTIGLAAGLSVAFVYLLMGFLFESFWLPMSIITTIPLAGIGVVWSHVFAGLDIDPLGFVGVVLLIGVVVNNGIVLVDYVNRLRADGYSRTDALLQAAELRFRPIMMTAMTTICGMVPVTMSGATSIGMSYTSFGITLIGGLTTATLLTLLVVPVFYTLFDDLRNLLTAEVEVTGQ